MTIFGKNIPLWFLAAVAVAALFGLGILSASQVQHRLEGWGHRIVWNVRSLFFTAGPSAAQLNAARSCQQNLRRLESAKRAVADRQGQSTGTISWDAVVREMGGQAPRCPSGGSYMLAPLGTMPRCTIGANGNADPRDDHLITHY